ncbi:MAG: YegS/Rv2252/BmrU family lipid kinase [Anaerolineales bacterium]|nr:YegS/Rv2252/BmrU family lipid kinase [Anaerolineales bacterium]
MRSAVIIYNPAAGRFSVKPFIKSVVKTLEAAGWQADAAETKSGEHTVQLARQASVEKKEAAFVVGGDGTIGNVVNGLIDSDTALGVLPAGTANVWSAELGLRAFTLGNFWALKRNAKLLASAPCYAIDVGLCNDVSFVMWAGIGLDALTIHAIEPRVRFEKFFAFTEFTAQTLMKAAQWKGVKLRLWADGVEVAGQYIVAVATNIRHYLGGLSKLSPNAYLDDGLLDMWLFSGSHLGDAFRHAYEMVTGKHINSDAARKITFSSLRVEADSPFLIQTDGEPRGSAQKVEINVKRGALKLLMPPHAEKLLKPS